MARRLNRAHLSNQTAFGENLNWLLAQLQASPKRDPNLKETAPKNLSELAAVDATSRNLVDRSQRSLGRILDPCELGRMVAFTAPSGTRTSSGTAELIHSLADSVLYFNNMNVLCSS